MSHSFEPDFASPSEWANMYRDLGLQIVPALHPSENSKQWKRPALVSWREFEHELVPDFTFERWFGEQGEHVRRNNMGLICGACSGGVFVIDIDLHKHPTAQAWWLEQQDRQQQAGELETVEQVTGGGGIQLFFRAPAGWTPPTCKTSIGVDIRGQGGFAMMPPSMHESGQPYRWKAGCEPWDKELAEAPQWLCDAVVKLSIEHGGASGVNPVTGQREQTSSPTHALDSFGNLVDGREDYMTKLVWAAVVDLRRDAPIPLSASASVAEMMAAFGNYERHVKSRLVEPGTSNADLLEREGRGITMFAQKWQYALTQWDTKVAEHAAEGIPASEAEPSEQFRFKGFAANAVDLNLSNAWLVKGILPEKGFAIVYGAPGSGKSFFVVDLVAHIASPEIQIWRNRKVKSGPVAYCFLEGEFGAKKRMHALRDRFPNLTDLVCYPHSMNLSFPPTQAGVRSHPSDTAHLIDCIRGQQGSVSVLVVDTLSRAMSGKDENSSSDMTAFISAIDYLAKELDCLVIVVHHSGKDQQRGARGHSSLNAAVDAELEVTHPEKHTSNRFVKVTKSRDGEDNLSFGFELQQVTIGYDEDDEAVTSCVVIASEVDSQLTKSPQLGPNEKSVLNAFETFQCDHPDTMTPFGTGFPDISAHCVEAEAFRVFAMGRMPADGDNVRRVRDALRGLISKGFIAINRGLIWRIR